MANFTVTTFSDIVDAGDGETSLREALELANADPQTPDTITFNTGGTLTLAQGELVIAGVVTINGDVNGDGKADVTIDANHASRVIHITAGEVGLHSLTLTGGQVTTGGAGVFVAAGASADIVASTITGNSTSGSSSARGGGIRNEGTTTLINSTVSNNYGANAGGIFNPGGTLSVINTTVSGNSSNIYVGGIYSVSGHLDITNSTVSGNFGGPSLAGGIMSLNDQGTLSNSIVAGNFGHGGVADLSVSAFTNSLGFAGVNVFSQAGVGGAGDIHEADLGNIFAAVTTVDPDGTPGNGNEFQAGVLADNGGPVQTIAIKAGGVAHNGGDTASAVFDHDGDPLTADQPIATDARGFARDVAGVDIGALEIQGSTAFVVTTLTDEVFDGGDLAAETADGGGLSLREALALANANPNSADSIAFSASLAGGSNAGVDDGHLTLTNGQLVIAGDVAINGDVDANGSPDIIIDAAGNSRVLSVAAGASTLQGLVITGGNSIYGAGVDVGTSAHLTIVNSAVTNSHLGGGIRNTGTLRLDGVTVSGNSSSADGGGIANALAGVLNVFNSTIANNAAAFNGGGLAMSGGTRASLANVTMSGNEAHGPYGGGAIYSGGNLTLSQATITGNRADANGGAIHIGAGSVQISNSIIAGSAADGIDDDVFVSGAANPIDYAGANVVGTGSDTDASDSVVQAPTLQDLFANVAANAATGVVSGVLANNGGTVQTVALAALASNPALDVSSSSAPATDARGVARDDLSLIANANGSAADLGAYELQDELTITGTVAGQAITDQQTLAPFTGVAIADPDHPAQVVTVTVTLDQPGQGAFTPASLTASGFTLNSGVAGQYDFAGTVTAATAAIHQLVFAPAANTHATLIFSIGVSDGLVGASDTQTTVVVSDVTLPAAPTLALSHDNGTSASDNLTNDPTIVYTGESGATLLYKVDGAASFSATVPNFATDGSADGIHTVSVRQQDAAGNIGPVASLTFTLDTTTPAAPAIALANDTGALGTDRITSNPTIVYGVPETGATLLYKVDSAANFTTAVPNFATDGSADGVHTVSVQQRDAAGNLGAVASLTFTLDTTAPAAPGIALAQDSGISAADRITNDAAIVYGAVENGGTLLYKADGAANFSTTVPTFATDGSADGVHTVSVQQRDSAGNVGNASSLTFTLDTTAPHLTGIVASPASGNNIAGSTIDFTLAFNEAVRVNGGPPELLLNDGATADHDAAGTAALNNAQKLAFNYLVSSSDPRTPSLAVSGFVAHGATVQDLAGNSADLTGVTATFNGLSVNDPGGTIIPAFTINGFTRPALLLDYTGHLILDHAAAQFMAEYGTKALYLGLPASTPFPPVIDTHSDFHLV